MSDVTIDKFNLDSEWEKQAELVEQAGLDHANAILLRDEAKDELDTGAAAMKLDVRANPERYGLSSKDKLTVDVVESAVLSSRTYRESLEDLREAQHKVNVLAARKAALDNKKTALESLTKLIIYSYYYKPDLKDSEKTAYTQAVTQEALSDALTDAMSKRLKE